jgi:SAM-dependent methyltransferase
MITPFLLASICCPVCHGPIEPGVPSLLRCGSCGASYPQCSVEYLDLRPPTAFSEQTKYLDETLHADARHEIVSPPLLQSGVRQRQLRRALKLSPDDRVIDLGCGSGRSILWNASSQAQFIGVDVSPFFAAEARAQVGLMLADLRQLPFRSGTFTKAYALDVLEHLSPEALAAVLRAAARVLAPGGQLFVYSHVRKNATIAKGLRAINALARVLERQGALDLSQERLRKSDHVNPLADVPHFERVVAAAGFRIGRIRYYTPLIGGFIENIVVRFAEQALAKRARRRAIAAGNREETAGLRAARLEAKARIARRGPLAWSLHALTYVMELDMLLFGRIRSGPFFALLVKDQ